MTLSSARSCDNGVRIEETADLADHKSTEKVYRHQLRPVISTGAVAMNIVFATKTRARPA
jgi:hypothetical protein